MTQTTEWTGTNGLSLTSSATWDTNDDITETVDARGYATDYSYDAKGNTVAVAAPSITTASQGTLRPTSLYTYDGSSNLLAYCDPNSNANSGRNWLGSGAPPSCPNASSRSWMGRCRIRGTPSRR